MHSPELHLEPIFPRASFECTRIEISMQCQFCSFCILSQLTLSFDMQQRAGNLFESIFVSDMRLNLNSKMEKRILFRFFLIVWFECQMQMSYLLFPHNPRDSKIMLFWWKMCHNSQLALLSLRVCYVKNL